MIMFTITSITPYLIISAFFVLVGYGVVNNSAFYAEAAKKSSTNRFANLDALRGFLALGVMVHHSVSCYYYLISGKWQTNGSNFYTALGVVSVTLFFMITGFLFWSKVDATKGNLDVKAYFVSRLRRIAPMYYVSMVLVLLLTFAATHFRLLEHPHEVANELFKICLLGWYGYFPVNNFPDITKMDGVYWTLAYEWKFYLALPFLAWFVYGTRWREIAFLVLVFTIKYFDPGQVYLINFAFGAIAAILVKSPKFCNLLRGPAGSLVAIVCIFIALTKIQPIYGFHQSVPLFVFFICVASGNSLFNLLRLQSTTVLGVISYSIYLLHMSFVYTVLRAVRHFVPLESVSPFQFWALVGAIGAVVILLSSITYRIVEHRYLAKGKTVKKILVM